MRIVRHLVDQLEGALEIDRAGGRTEIRLRVPLCGPPFDGLDRATAVVVFVAISSWMAVGAGITGFILLNVERSTQSPR